MFRKETLIAFSLIAVLFAANLAYAEDETKGSVMFRVGTAQTKTVFFEEGNGTNAALGFRLAFNLFHDKGWFLKRLSVEPSFLFIPAHSEREGQFKLRERIYQPAVDLGFKALDTERFDIVTYAGAAFSRDSFTIAQRTYSGYSNVCPYLEEGICQGRWSVPGRGGARFLYFPKKGSKLFLGADVNTRKQFLFMIGTEF